MTSPNVGTCPVVPPEVVKVNVYGRWLWSYWRWECTCGQQGRRHRDWHPAFKDAEIHALTHTQPGIPPLIDEAAE